MALQSSGAISLNDIHTEVGGSSASQVSVNDTDVRSLIGKGSGSQSAFNEFYGASAGFPSSIMVKSTYLGRTQPQSLGTNYGSDVTAANGFAHYGSNMLLTWTVPSGMNQVVRFKVKGAAGGTHTGSWGSYYCQPGSGALVDVSFYCNSGTVIGLVPGQRPSSTSSNSGNGSGGGGGSFVYIISNSFLIAAAGGGGGTGHGYNGFATGGMGLGGSSNTNSNEFGGSSSTNTGQIYNNYRNAQVYTAGSSGNNGVGLGGNQTNNSTTYGGSGGGAGWNGGGDNYYSNSGGESRDVWTGGYGDQSVTNGGYGGGGGSSGNGNAAGGGGGYTGGGAGHGWQNTALGRNSWGCGGGGGSYPQVSGSGVTLNSITAGVTAFGGINTGNADNGYIEIIT